MTGAPRGLPRDVTLALIAEAERFSTWCVVYICWRPRLSRMGRIHQGTSGSQMKAVAGCSVTGLPLEHVLTAAELDAKPSSALDYRRENRALTRLMEAAASPPSTAGTSKSQRASYVLQQLAGTALELCRVESAGISTRS
jgi:hypothetical protein